MEEAGGGSAVEDAVVEGEAEGHLLAAGERAVFECDGFTNNGAEAEDGGLGIVDDGREAFDAKAAEIGDGETAALHVRAAQTARAGGFDEQS